jgi:hypothetical protein
LSTLIAILTHQPAPAVELMVNAWGPDTLVLYGGERGEFDKVRWKNSVFIEDLRLRTVRHREDRQSYTEVFQKIAAHTAGYSHVLFGEYDLVPLAPIPEILQLYRELLKAEDADALLPLVYEVQGTCQEVWLPYKNDERFWDFWKTVTLRPDPASILWALMPGSFWRSEVIRAIAEVNEPFPIYFEIFLPTLAHHIGSRLRTLTDHRILIHGGKSLDDRGTELRAAGVLVAHPMKNSWNREVDELR